MLCPHVPLLPPFAVLSAPEMGFPLLFLSLLLSPVQLSPALLLSLMALFFLLYPVYQIPSNQTKTTAFHFPPLFPAHVPGRWYTSPPHIHVSPQGTVPLLHSLQNPVVRMQGRHPSFPLILLLFLYLPVLQPVQFLRHHGKNHL